MNIIQYPNSKLLQECVDVEKVDDELRSKMEEMLRFVLTENHLGLSAPQIGDNQNYFVTNFYPFYFINPIIKSKYGNKIVEPEGCVSLPGIYVDVPRFTKIDVEFFSLTGEEYHITLKEEEARIFQHEYDHLQGILILSYYV